MTPAYSGTSAPTSRPAPNYPVGPGNGGGCISVPTGKIQPCAFRLDVQWILDAIQKVQDTIKKVRDVMNKVLDVADRFMQALSKIMDLFCWIGGVKMAKKIVENACRVIRQVVNIVSTIYDKILEVSKHFLAPWEVRSAGEQIRDDLAQKCQEFVDQLNTIHLKSTRSWTGQAADRFRQSMQKQQEAAEQTANDAKQFGEKVQEIGQKGIDTTINFITKLVGAIAGIIQAALTMAAVPAGTAIGAAEIIGLVSAIFAYIMVFVNAMLEIIQQSSELGKAGSAVHGGKWPRVLASAG